MRSAVLISGLVGALAGIAGDHLLRSQSGEAAPALDSAARDAAAGRFEQCVARLDAIDGQLAKLASAPAAPTRTDAGDALAPKLEERLAAIEAAITSLAASKTLPAQGREEPPRRSKDAAAIARLYEVEHGKQPQRTDDHQGYTAQRLYERYGAPDAIEHSSDGPAIQRWVYFETSDDHGIYFELWNGVVIRTWAYAR